MRTLLVIQSVLLAAFILMLVGVICNPFIISVSLAANGLTVPLILHTVTKRKKRQEFIPNDPSQIDARPSL